MITLEVQATLQWRACLFAGPSALRRRGSEPQSSPILASKLGMRISAGLWRVADFDAKACNL